MTNVNHQNNGSFKDPFGSVFEFKERIFRGIKKSKSIHVKNFLDSTFYKDSENNELIKTVIVDKDSLLSLGLEKILIEEYDLWLEHEKVDLITYPYEWSFEYLKKAAMFHLDLQIKAIKAGYQIKDSSAFNIQFIYGKPIFIDILSFDKYEDGDYWLGYKQFCEQFLAPILINSEIKINHNNFIKGDLNGVDITTLAKILPIKSFFKPLVFFHVYLQSLAVKAINATSKKKINKTKIKKNNLIAMIDSIRKNIEKISISKKTYWSDYEEKNSYSKISTEKKEEIISNFVKKYELKKILDLGCNTGQYSEILFSSGAKNVIGLDFDSGAINLASNRRAFKDKNFTPLVFDLVNPSPSLGWNLKERTPLEFRLKNVDGLICLALIHHLVISKNIPLPNVINYISKLSKYAVIEFVPKEDEMVKSLLQNREDIFFDYNEVNFINNIKKNFELLSVQNIPESYRKLIVCKSLNYDKN